MVLMSTKICPVTINISGILTDMILLSSLYKATWYRRSSSLLAWFLPKFAYLSMSFIIHLPALHQIGINSILKEKEYAEGGGGKLKLDSLDVAQCAEHSDITFVVVSQRLIECNQFIV